MRSLGSLFRRTALCVLAFSLLTLTAVGCGQSTGNISGKVTYQGKPLPGGSVNFLGDKNVLKTSGIKEDGSYSLSGFPVGPAKISVQGRTKRRLAALPGQGKGDEAPQQTEVFVPPQYSNMETSELQYDVKAGSQSHDIDLK